MVVVPIFEIFTQQPIKMNQIERLPAAVPPTNPVHPNAKSTTHMNNGTTTTKTNISTPVCRNCKTQTTPLWRRDETGQVLCNACGLFLKLHGRPRPISLKTDTIKSRNRIKQPNSAKSSGPNTPELKSKDSKLPSLNGSGKKSPKPKKRSPTPVNGQQSEGGMLTPLLPASGSKSFAGSNGSFNTPLNYNQHLSQHLTHQVQPLHYPSSTPTQFAPGLQRITSPLLLSTTSSISNARGNSKPPAPSTNGTLSAVQAAGALENMSNELGPSASFHKTSRPHSTGFSLMNNDRYDSLKKESPPLISALSSQNGSLSIPPKLPSIVNNSSSTPAKTVSSPSFGPQFSMNSQNSVNKTPPHSTPLSSFSSNIHSHNHSPETSVTSLPPLQKLSSSKPSLPHLPSSFSSLGRQDGSTLPGINSLRNESSNEKGDSSGKQNTPSKQNDDNGLDGNSGEDRDKRSSNSEDVTLLKTRISELELVNDLYRTRIMELEAMEQAARLRENSMKRRLDEIMGARDNESKRAKFG